MGLFPGRTLLAPLSPRHHLLLEATVEGDHLVHQLRPHGRVERAADQPQVAGAEGRHEHLAEPVEEGPGEALQVSALRQRVLAAKDPGGGVEGRLCPVRARTPRPGGRTWR